MCRYHDVVKHILDIVSRNPNLSEELGEMRRRNRVDHLQGWAKQRGMIEVHGIGLLRRRGAVSPPIYPLVKSSSSGPENRSADVELGDRAPEPYGLRAQRTSTWAAARILAHAVAH